ncbi:MAG: DUF420 domain-containing protein [Bacteroidetes bacterium]|nr:MAG: DUF420 domain-containing protein [Bacteroidota bacterium]
MLDFLPTLNAILNSTSAILLLIGRSYIKKYDRATHKKYMLAAFTVSTLFLISYLTYHYFHGTTRFQHEGFIRALYFIILTSHTILAAVLAPMVIITLLRGLKEKFTLHKKIAKWTYPIWLYVSVTGVIVYLMLYHL